MGKTQLGGVNDLSKIAEPASGKIQEKVFLQTSTLQEIKIDWIYSS